MFKKIFAFVGLAAIIIGAIAGLNWYNERQKRVAEARARAAANKIPEIKLTIIEGWDLNDIQAALEKNKLGGEQTLGEASKTFDDSKYRYLARPVGKSLEGYLYPDTYMIFANQTTEQIIAKLVDNFSKKISSLDLPADLTNIVISGYENLNIKGGDGIEGMSLYDIVTLASIIELESGGKGSVSDAGMTLQEEHELVAGVFYNRLQKGMGLESDATVNYITGKNDPGVSIKDTQVSSPYNTYKYAGLPPGPICNPSIGSIKAALNPAKTDFFFFLHKQPSGKVDFSKTFEEHVSKK